MARNASEKPAQIAKKPNHYYENSTWSQTPARNFLAATLLTASNLPLLAQFDTYDIAGLELPLVESPPNFGTFWRLSSYFYDTTDAQVLAPAHAAHPAGG